MSTIEQDGGPPEIGLHMSPRHMYLTTPEPTPPLFTSSIVDFDFSGNLHSLLAPHEFLAVDGRENFDSCPLVTGILPSSPSSSHSPTSYRSPSKVQMIACSDGTESCMQLALKAVRSLQAPSQAQPCIFNRDLEPDVHQARMMDVTLTTSRDAMQAVSRILDCSCIDSSALQITVVIICNKLMDWNHAILSAGEEAFASSDNQTLKNRGSHFAQKVAQQPIRIGGFALNDALADRLRATIVLEELQLLESLVKQLAERVQGGAASRAFSKTAQRNLLKLLCRRIESSMVESASKM